MKKINNINRAFILLTVLSVMFACERGLSDDVEFASFPTTGDIFTDAPVGLTDEFFVSFDPAGGANPEGFGTDDNEAFEGTSSIRIDVPAPNDPNGGFIGGIFLDRGAGRDLSGYDALTFWARASTTANIGLFGFGTDFGENKFSVGKLNTQLSTDWRKYTIPIPDASKLIQEKGMFIFSAGGLDIIDSVPNGNEIGFTFWIDELRFENLGTVAQPRPRIFNGQDVMQQGFTDTSVTVVGLSQTFNLEDGSNTTVEPAASYFDFKSSNLDVAIVNELGEVSIIGEGTAIITAQLAGVLAEGSLTLEVGGSFDAADTPPVRDPADVISIFSDAYTNVDNLNFAVFNDSDVQIETQNLGGDNIVNYNNLTFVGLGWDGTENVSAMEFLHIDVQVTSSMSPNLTIELIDFGADNADGGGDDTGGGFSVPASQLVEGTWVGIDIPVNGFTLGTGGGFFGSPNLNNISRVVLVSNGGSFAVDNIYFYRD
ncbi:glycosyl hydrolase family 16 [Winogradskyella haliclonae]|uniref:Glycosyl hydrolase family 16 n=1 Tax=Winogradskyella haliclonae TaxID=2048558 RepID=A0ABQ2BVZ6_9FLAO|nr:glycosyl hydrolase family 16 [Winogradskyella haliclonae]GGI56620.1 hypothetical protein GCM10011444_09290 [Winogradskyella haliclonae]